jgi:glycosyltransferase involved in cell wall biosynthesis
MRIVAIIAAYNEEQFIGNCVRHLVQQGVGVYLMDNSSADNTIQVAKEAAGAGLVGVETVPRDGCFAWKDLLRRKEELAGELHAHWFMQVDADEIRLPPSSRRSLAEALEEADAQGYNAVNFLEFTFIPTREEPDHDHPNYQSTMRWYYPFLPSFPHRLNAWKRQATRVDLRSSGGHRVSFPDLRMFPQSFPMRHYLFLSREHIGRKYVNRGFPDAEIKAGWHGWRATIQPERIVLPAQGELRRYTTDDALDPSQPRTRHYLDEASLIECRDTSSSAA